MKRFVITFSLAMIYCAMVVGQTTTKESPYSSGEKLRYNLFYGLMDGGEAVLTLDKTSSGLFHSKVTAKTVGMVRWFLDLNDVYESYFDPETSKPTKAIRDISENNYKYYDEVTYNHNNYTVNSKKNGEVSVPKEVYDIVSSLYQMRKSGFRNMKYNDTLTTTIFFADEIYNFQVIYKGKSKVTTKLGTFNALKFQPVVETGRVFKNKDDVRFWVSDDENMLPLRAEFDVLIGSIKCDLIEYSGIKYPVSKVKK